MNRLTQLFFLLMIPFISTGQVDKSKPVSIGSSHEIISKQLSEQRILNIYLPEGYSENDTIKYPVIYLLDGGVDEDFVHTVGLVQFNTQPWVNRMPKSIVVGIANTDRKRDMTFITTIKADKDKLPTAGGSDKFIAFIEKELQPYIQQQYKTNGANTLIGESLAGLLATEILLKKPCLFNKYIIISPSLWWDNGSILKQQWTLPAGNDISIYIGVGKEGLTPTEPPRVMEVDANLLADNIKTAAGGKHIKFVFDYLPDENHATVAHQALMNAFRMLYAIP